MMFWQIDRLTRASGHGLPDHLSSPVSAVGSLLRPGAVPLDVVRAFLHFRGRDHDRLPNECKQFLRLR